MQCGIDARSHSSENRHPDLAYLKHYQPDVVVGDNGDIFMPMGTKWNNRIMVYSKDGDFLRTSTG